jgi:hypothetical protein
MFKANFSEEGLLCSICSYLITPHERLSSYQKQAITGDPEHLPSICKSCISQQKNGVLLWLDDLRNPFSGNWIRDFAPEYFSLGKIIWVKSYDDFTKWIKYNGLPQKICFDHDLGEDVAMELVSYGMTKSKAREVKKLAKSGFDCAKWLVDYCLDNKIQMPEWEIQSANPVGKENINSLLNNARKHIETNL